MKVSVKRKTPPAFGPNMSKSNSGGGGNQCRSGGGGNGKSGKG